jgi:hypothetical protein
LIFGGQWHTHILPLNPRGCWILVDSTFRVTPKVTPASRSGGAAATNLILESVRLGEHAV